MKARGFTLVELVVAISISAIVVVFAAMFIGAPLGAYEAHSRRVVLVADASGAWPRMEQDLRASLPNSLRARRNGNVVVMEMLPVMGVARYLTSPSAVAFTIAGPYTGAVPDYLSVNNRGVGAENAYAVAGSMAVASNFDRGPPPSGNSGEQEITLNPAPAFLGSSIRSAIYFVSRPVSYLCDEGQGTLRRYSGYSIALNHSARDTSAELAGAGAAVELVARGLSSCNFEVTPPGSTTQSQTAAVRLTTTRNGDVVTLLHSTRSEFVP